MKSERLRNVRLFGFAPRPTLPRPGGRKKLRISDHFPTSLAAACLTAIVVIDADTVERAGVRYRIAGIDAPEIHGARCPAERQRGLVAAARLVTLLAERGGRLIAQGREKYGRTVATLIVGWPSSGEEAWAAIAVREGLAVAWDGRGKRPGWC
jgi:micrococcal nuclease